MGTFLRDPDDPPSLACGHPEKRLRRAVVALDADDHAVASARRRRADLLLAHHPPFFNPPSTLRGDGEAGRRAEAYLRAGLAVAALHGMLDQAPGGAGDILATGLGLDCLEPAVPAVREPLLKLTVFVPETSHEAVRLALAETGAGGMGSYRDCSFSADGEGVFRPEPGARPHIGRPGRLQRVRERRLEVILPQRLAARAETVLRRVHPYETPAYDFIRLEQGQAYGPGRYGRLRQPASLPDLAARAATFVRRAGGFGKPVLAKWHAPRTGARRKVRSLMVWPGGGFPVGRLRNPPPDAVVAGEMKYHDLASLLGLGVGVVLLGHAESEWPAVRVLARMAAAAWPGVDVAALPPPSPPEGWSRSGTESPATHEEP